MSDEYRRVLHAPLLCVCGHDIDDHDVPDWFDDGPPNPLYCQVPGCGCRDHEEPAARQETHP